MRMIKMEPELQTKLLKRKKKRERYQGESRQKHSDTENSSENAAPIDRRRPKEDAERSFRIFDAGKQKRRSNVGSTDLADVASKSMDVVVDIHREYSAGKRRDETVEDIDAIKTMQSPRHPQSFRVFSRTDAFRDRKRKVEVQKSKPDPSETLEKEHDDLEVVESLDLIEEFRGEATGDGRLAKESASRLLEAKPSRRQWGMQESRVEEPKKPPRRRWSKDTSVIRLPEAKGSSWATSSKKDASKGVVQQRPSAATRTSVKQSLSGIDNAAFVSENEEILRIETGHDQKDTRIEMAEIVGGLEIAELSDRCSRRSSVQERLEEVVTIDREESGDPVRSVDERWNTMVGIDENVSEKEKPGNRIKSFGESAEKERRDSDRSTASKSLEEVTLQSNYRSSDEMLPDQSRTKRRSKIHGRNLTDSEAYSDRRPVSTTEDDLEENHAKGARDERSRRFTTRRRKSKHVDKHRSQAEKERKSVRESASGASVPEDSKKKRKKKGTKYVSVMIHRADMLEIDYVTKHPMVKVHIVEAETGKYLKNERGTSGHLQPVITGKFDFKENKSIVPVWEEELVFECGFDVLLKTENEQVVILFEIIDLLSFAEASFNYDKFGHEGCWYKVAWAFLRPVGRNNALHVNKKVRLQLYKPRKNLKKFDRFHTCEVYTWWKSNNREKYPSSLFVTVTAIDPPKLEPVLYQQLSLNDLSDVRSESQKASTRTTDSINLPKWTRLAAQSCKIPNESVFETNVSENGCFFVAFSNDGKHLACSLSEEQDYPIVVYEVEGKKVHVQFSGHKTFVYSLNWSDNDKYLLSVSSDQTARIWDVQNQAMQHVEMMPHPSYVYCGKFDPESHAIVATGCYDRIARIWMRNRKSRNRDLSQELEGHEGFINSMCFQRNSDLLTADSVGIIIVWTVKRSRRAVSRKEWHISRKIRVREIDGVIINTIVLHPLESRLLVHSRNNGLRMLDLATGVVLRKYHELNNQRIQTTACVSPCGGLIFCGGEDSSLSVWRLETGRPLAKYNFDRNFRAVTCVDYHPYDHVLAYSTFGSPAPVRVLRFNKDSTGEDVGLKLMGETETKTDDSDIPVRLPSGVVVTTGERSHSNSGMQTPEEAARERVLQSGRSQRYNPVESLSSVFSDKEDAKTRLRRLNETEQTLKSRSANRLYNIIEKIDRILSNTSRSSGDLESGRNLACVQDASDMLTKQDVEAGVEKTKRKNKAAYLGADDCARSYFEPSTGNRGKKDEVFELKSLEHRRASNWNTKRSRSAKETRNREYEDDVAKVLSDSAANYREAKVYDETPETAVSSFILQTKENDTSHFFENGAFNDRSNSSDSAGTYVLEKSNVERNSDEDSIRFLETKDLIRSDTENDSNNAKQSGSDSSVPSNATFTIENEIPVPKPRRKKNLV